MRLLIALAALATLGGCVTAPRQEKAAARNDWRQVITEADRERLREWRSTFNRALVNARAAGHSSDMAREGALLEPDAGRGPGLPNGDYRCRIIKVGSRGEPLLNYIAYPAFTCRVVQQGAVQSFAKLSGSQRPVGTIYPADAIRSVMLGVLELGDETRPMRYGADPDRDLAGWVERVGPATWRIVFPAPRFESLTDVMELVPAG